MSILKCRKSLISIILTLTICFTQTTYSAVRNKELPLRYAKNFKIVDLYTHRIATVIVDSTSTTEAIQHQYALVPKGKPTPPLPKDITVIRTPVEDVAALETIYIGFLETLNQLDSIIGVATADYVVNSTIRKRIEEGTIQKIQAVRPFNPERLLILKPDLVFTSIPSEPTLNLQAKLARAGLPVVMTAEYKEYHPLARAEWIKFIAAFFDVSEQANTIFDEIVTQYEALLQKVDNVESRPNVFCGAPYSGVWHMASGDSYVAQLIHDAGGNYLWSHVRGSNAVPLDIERVFLKAANADVWLNPSFYKTRRTLIAADPRFKKFRAVQTGHIYNNTRQKIDSIGNPIWENGIVSPHDVLADLIKIFYPDQMLDWDFVYYEKLR